MPAIGIETMRERNDMTTPITTPAMTETTTANTLVQLNFVIVRLVSHQANTPARIVPTPRQTTETAMAAIPLLSLAPLSASIDTKRDKIAKMMSKIIVDMAEMRAGI